MQTTMLRRWWLVIILLIGLLSGGTVPSARAATPLPPGPRVLDASNFRDMWFDDERLYTFRGNNILEVRDPQGKVVPQLLGRVVVPTDRVDQIIWVRNKVVVLRVAEGLLALDLTNLDRPTVIGRLSANLTLLETDATRNRIVVRSAWPDGNHVQLVTLRQNGFNIDSQLVSPKIESYLLDGDRLYVTSTSQPDAESRWIVSLVTYAVEDFTAPRELGRARLPGVPSIGGTVGTTRLERIGPNTLRYTVQNTCFKTGCEQFTAVASLQDPAQPIQIRIASFDDRSVSVWTDGRWSLTNVGGQVQLYDLSDPQQPQQRTIYSSATGGTSRIADLRPGQLTLGV